MNETHLNGLEGTNPLGFLAALGVQVAFAHESYQPRLWWSDNVTPHAIVDGGFTFEQIAEKALELFDEWRGSPATNPTRPDGTLIPKGNELKLAPEDIRAYLAQIDQCGPSGALITALVAEGSLDKQRVSKPTDLYFTAGNQKFLSMARDIMSSVTRNEIMEGIQGPWNYRSELPSLMWDVNDDRVYALAADNPAKEKKFTNPGPEALGVLGLSMHPVFTGVNTTLTQGCSGKWKAGFYSWPLWSKPASLHAVKSLLAHAYDYPTLKSRYQWYPAWGVSRILRSPIRRSSPGGYGTFGPSEIVWQHAETHGAFE